MFTNKAPNQIGILLICLCISNKIQASTLDSLDLIVDDLTQFILYRNHDTNYIGNQSDKLAAKIFLKEKFNFFQLYDRELDEGLNYRPQFGLNPGFGLAYKWFSLDISFPVQLRHQAESSSKSQYFDFQARIFSQKQFIETTLQYYFGYVQDKNGLLNSNTEQDFIYRNDIRTIHLGLQYFYVSNYTRFSIRAPFIMNDIQKQCAGSFVYGVGFNIFNIDADSSMVPEHKQDAVNPELNYTDYNILSLSAKIGYMYSFVLKKHWFLTIGAIPGINLNAGDYYLKQRTPIGYHWSFNLKGTLALGYNGDSFYSGIKAISDAYGTRNTSQTGTRISHGELSVFVGYRF